MRVMIKIVCIIILWSCNQGLNAQQKDSNGSPALLIEKRKDNLSALLSNAPENFYITTDRPWYFQGEEIWFKTYITTNGLPVAGSRVLYVSFSDSSGSILIKKIFPIDDYGTSYGTIKLPSELKRGWYSLGVQTQRDRMFTNGFEKLIYVNERGRLPERIYLPYPEVQKENTVAFYPEGGNFIAGLQNHFGVKATGENREPAAVIGIIADPLLKDTLALFETAINGMGEFTLPAVTQRRLSVLIYWPDGKTTQETFPEMQSAGVTLQATVQNEKLFYKTESTPEFFSGIDTPVLTVSMHGEKIFSQPLTLTGNRLFLSESISLQSWPAGIIRLQLESATGKTLARREVFHYREKKISIESLLTSFEPKGKNEWQIAFPDTLNGTYCVSITDAALSPDENLSGTRFPAAMEPFALYHFSRNSKDLNLCLLMQDMESAGVYREKTADIFRDDEEQGLTVSGNVFYTKSGKPVAGREIFFFPKNSLSGSFIIADTTDAAGNFELKNLWLEDSTVLIWNIRGLSKSELNRISVQLHKTWFDSLASRFTVLKNGKIIRQEIKPEMEVQQQLQDYFRADSVLQARGQTLPEVVIYARQQKRLEELDKLYAPTGLFAGRWGNVQAFDIEEEKGYYSNIFSFLQSRIPGLKITGPPHKPLLLYRSLGDPATGEQVTNVAIFVNENRLYEASDFSNIPVSEIAYVKVFKPPFSYVLVSDAPSKEMNSPSKISLVIAIYLKKGKPRNPTENTISAFQGFTVSGFSLPGKFMSPDYSQKNDFEKIPDNRITLYWNPELEVMNGRSKIIFYNNDFSKKFLIRIEGINEMGEVVSWKQVIGH
jgi:hypothetical protein